MRAPVPSYNFASQPVVDDRDPLWRDPDLTVRMQRGEFYLGYCYYNTYDWGKALEALRT